MGEKEQFSDGAVTGAKEASDLAKLSAEVLDLGLVRESRPVFVFDKTLAKEKKGNAERQEKHRKEKEKQGLKLGFAPVDALEKVKALGGGPDGWAKYLASIKEASLSGGVGPVVEPVVQRIEVPVIKEVFVEKEIIKEVIKEIPIEVFIEKIIEKEILKEVPGPIQKIEIEKPFTAEQKKTIYIGEKVRALTGFRRKLVKFLIGI